MYYYVPGNLRVQICFLPFQPALVGADDGRVDLDEPVDNTGSARLSLDLPQGPGEHAAEGVTT
ncbi:hypothetical protein AB0E04_39740 [Streptomyces sp. NPDC048251]|uniref:hypothetical protein n=1 Tax=Streptomyces sp. NPDC048251 TaxID=3154501 RepID=UPI00343EB301